MKSSNFMLIIISRLRETEERLMRIRSLSSRGGATIEADNLTHCVRTSSTEGCLLHVDWMIKKVCIVVGKGTQLDDKLACPLPYTVQPKNLMQTQCYRNVQNCVRMNAESN
jgi:hypothetical protein